MNRRAKFDISKLRGKLSQIRDWLNSKHIPPRLLFVLMGIISTIWFLFRVIPKPSRANYPCMQVAAPVMSGFVLYLLSIGGITFAFRKIRQNLAHHKYWVAASFVLVILVSLLISLSPGALDSFAGTFGPNGPEDGPNQPIGKAGGVNPGRVVWIWNPKATNENCVSNFDTKDWFFKSKNIDQKVVGTMVRNALNKLSGKKTVSQSWDVLFRYQNSKKYQKNRGYSKGEKIFIKINQGTSRWLLTQEDKNKGYNYPETLNPDEDRRRLSLGSTETNPYVVLELLKELVNEIGIKQEDISIGDPMTDIYGHNYEVWFKEFPKVAYIDKFSAMNGRTLIQPTSNDLIFYSDKSQNDKLYDVIEKADYLINLACLKPHVSAGISLTAKNHFGSQASPTAGHLHYSLMMPRNGVASNGGYHKYRVLVDLMGSKYLGQNTVLYMVDGLFGGGASETKGPVKYFMSPFNNDWCNSIFVSQDQVALESVCYDFLRTEWDGINKHNPLNCNPEAGPNMNGVDDYLHQAADSANWPKDVSYDPDNSGKPIPSLGTHEHWNNAENKQYSRNLGKNKGIELISIPDTLVNSKVPSIKNRETGNSLKHGIAANSFYAALVDDNNVKWFLTEAGVVSFDGESWILHDKNLKVTTKDLKSFAYEASSFGKEVYIATPTGATVATLPIDATTGATTYYSGNSTIVSENIFSVAIGKSPLRWFGTEKGISAFYDNKWLVNANMRRYPENLFKAYPITAMSTTLDGDTLYAATNGGGVARVFKNKVDAISGASPYSLWGPILMPSDKVYSICIAPDRTQWFGTDKGVARHIGSITLEKWTVFNTGNGLADNFVQSITIDKKGKMWFGTKGGVSVYDGTSWTSFTEKDGLNSNNVRCITVDHDDVVWLGTDKGVNSFNNGIFTSYQ